jgi:hypothetical protein
VVIRAHQCGSPGALRPLGTVAIAPPDLPPPEMQSRRELRASPDDGAADGLRHRPPPAAAKAVQTYSDVLRCNQVTLKSQSGRNQRSSVSLTCAAARLLSLTDSSWAVSSGSWLLNRASRAAARAAAAACVFSSVSCSRRSFGEERGHQHWSSVVISALIREGHEWSSALVISGHQCAHQRRPSEKAITCACSCSTKRSELLWNSSSLTIFASFARYSLSLAILASSARYSASLALASSAAFSDSRRT